MGIKSYIVNFLKFLKHGGVKYVSVTFTNPDARYTKKKNCQTSSFPKVMPSFIRWYGTPWILTLISRSSIKPFP